MNEDITVLVLAAGTTKSKFINFSFLFDSPAFVPIASRSALSYILSSYSAFKIYVAVNASELELFRKEFAFYSGLQFIPIAASEGVFDTLNQSLSFIASKHVLVSVATTIPTFEVDINTVYISGEETNHIGYSGLAYDENGQILNYVIKNSNFKEQFNAFTGVFSAETSIVKNAIKKLPKSGDILELVEMLVKEGKEPFNFQKVSWIDVGHEINYADARRSLIVSRSFNSIHINKLSGILTKRSKHEMKLYGEAEFVSMLPKELQVLYPRVVSNVMGSGIVEMEYYGYPNLSEIQLFRNVDPIQWGRVFDSLFNVLELQQKYRFSIGRQAFEDFYFKKTDDRVKEFLATEGAELPIFAQKSVTINSLVCLNYESIRDKILDRIAALYDEGSFCVMHGDFCFNNILYDINSDSIKLIDPRGSFGDQCIGIYGDSRYDVAKLMHSTMGKYDYIVNNLFCIDFSDTSVTYSFAERESQRLIEEYSDSLMQKMKLKREDILFLVGLCFLSMSPLHADSLPRQRLMFLHGLYFVNKYL